jgi:cobalt-zinc-cadmium efflux system protein
LRLLTQPGHSSINTRAAMLHVAGDLLGSVAAIVASVIIMLSGWMQADPLLSVLVAALIVRGGYSIVRESGHILLEGTPEEVHPTQVGERLMAQIPEILDVHHVHIWSLTDERPVLTLHARVATSVDHDRIMHDIHEALETLFGVSHATVQLEYGPCTDDHKAH